MLEALRGLSVPVRALAGPRPTDHAASSIHGAVAVSAHGPRAQHGRFVPRGTTRRCQVRGTDPASRCARARP